MHTISIKDPVLVKPVLTYVYSIGISTRICIHRYTQVYSGITQVYSGVLRCTQVYSGVLVYMYSYVIYTYKV